MAANPDPSRITDALWRFWEEAKAAIGPDLLLGGIYANKGGYHNTRDNHLRDRPDDYSIQAPADRLGPGDKAAAIDLTFDTARRSDFRAIAKYSKRLLAAFKARDARLFHHDGQAVVREFFGNADLDREVEGWSLYRGHAVSSDSSHLWHIHISFHRKSVADWDAVSGVLAVLLDTDPEDDMTPAQVRDAVDDALKAFLNRNVGEYHNGNKMDVQAAMVGGARYAYLTMTIAKEIAAQAGVDVDEAALAKELAPLLIPHVQALSDVDVQRIATACNDELARRAAV